MTDLRTTLLHHAKVVRRMRRVTRDQPGMTKYWEGVMTGIRIAWNHAKEES